MTQNISYIWGETEKKSPENDNAELAMREQLDEHANFIIDDSGVMEFDNYIVLRCVIQR